MYAGDYLYKIISCEIFKTMRNVLLLMMITVFQVYAVEGYSQNTKLTLDLNNVTVGNVLEEIENQSEFYFLFNAKLIDIEREVSISIEDQSISNILASLFSGTGVSITVRDRLIILTPGDMPAEVPEIPLQQQIITGSVTDIQTGDAMPGVNIQVKGTTLGSITDVEGKYSISVPDRNATLVFSFIGFVLQEIPLTGRTSINVALTAELTGLDEVVVVGYSTQRRANLSGSVTTVKVDELSSVTMPTLAQSIMGRSPGLFIKNVNGQPGDATAISINIRGFGSPLIIIDGVPATDNEFQQIDPNDIENFSVLKDAAAASVYGARAGNGVILVTTKRGSITDTKVTINSVMQWQHFLLIPEWVGSEAYARMENLSRYNMELPPLWTDDQIQKFADGSDPVNYPNTDWWDKTVRPFAPQTQQNINIQGGNDKVKYFVSGGYFYQEAMLRANDTKNKRYNLRSNIDIALTEKMDLNLDLSAMYQDYIGPIVEMERNSSNGGLMMPMFRSRPYWQFEFPDKTKTPDWETGYYISFIENVGYKNWNRLNVDAKIGLSYELPLNIKAKALFHLNKENYNNKEKSGVAKSWYKYDWNTQVYTISRTGTDQTIYHRATNTNRVDQQYFLTWNNKFTDNNISAMVVYELLSSDQNWLEASRRRYAFDIDYLFAGPDLDKNNNGSASEDGRKAIISRINYDYKGKYLLELNARYDASAKFPPETRWGFFPSASVAWRLSEEGFIKNSLPFVTNLKIRASYGKLGYDATGSFQYLATYSITSLKIYDGTTNILSNGIKADALPNTEITWEKMTTSNIGIDFNLWKNLLEGTFDVFYRLRTDVLGSRIASIPNIVGASMPQVNYAEYDNRGWEFSLNHINKIGDIEYNIGGNISWNREKTVFIDQGVYSNEELKRRGNRIGEWTDRFWAIQCDGIFQSKEEIMNWADQDGKNNATILPGDLKYVDYNGDGKITADDQVVIGRGDFPKLMYGINMSATWKGIDLSLLWQGAGAYDFNLRNCPDFIYVFYGSNTPMTYMMNDAYVPENPWVPIHTTNVKFPLYRGSDYNRAHPSFTTNSDYWLIDGKYLRLKNIELGYTLPTSLTRKLGIDRCKFYVSGYNLLTFSAIDYLDPEADTHTERVFGSYYPPVGTYNIGLLLQF
jgi:TonB-linked SusC/RagA family outer membrane protein